MEDKAKYERDRVEEAKRTLMMRQASMPRTETLQPYMESNPYDSMTRHTIAYMSPLKN